MQETFEIQAQPRTDSGKGASRRLRRRGSLPGIIYGAHQAPVMVTLEHREMLLHLSSEAFYSHILTLNLAGAKERVVLKDLQRHPYKPVVLHADFQRVSESELIRIRVPLHFANQTTAPGVKKGGLISHAVTEVEIACLPRDLPEFIEVDTGLLELGQSIHLSELTLPTGVQLAHKPEPDLPVVSVHGARGGGSDEETAVTAVTAAAAPAAAKPAGAKPAAAKPAAAKSTSK
ncbi:MAG: 50S ribosomal protein L25/general stress protein Ctc [Pseudomonadota bacterium]